MARRIIAKQKEARSVKLLINMNRRGSRNKKIDSFLWEESFQNLIPVGLTAQDTHTLRGIRGSATAQYTGLHDISSNLITKRKKRFGVSRISLFFQVYGPSDLRGLLTHRYLAGHYNELVQLMTMLNCVARNAGLSYLLSYLIFRRYWKIIENY